MKGNLRLLDSRPTNGDFGRSAAANEPTLPDAEAFDAYSRTVAGVAERLGPSVAHLTVSRRTRRCGVGAWPADPTGPGARAIRERDQAGGGVDPRNRGGGVGGGVGGGGGDQPRGCRHRPGPGWADKRNDPPHRL